MAMLEAACELQRADSYNLEVSTMNTQYFPFSPLFNVEPGTAEFTGKVAHLMGFSFSLYGEFRYYQVEGFPLKDWVRVPVRVTVFRIKEAWEGKINSPTVFDNADYLARCGGLFSGNDFGAPTRRDHPEYDVLYDKTVYTTEKTNFDNTYAILSHHVTIDEDFYTHIGDFELESAFLMNVYVIGTSHTVYGNWRNDMPLIIVSVPTQYYSSASGNILGVSIGGELHCSTNALIMNM